MRWWEKEMVRGRYGERGRGGDCERGRKGDGDILSGGRRETSSVGQAHKKEVETKSNRIENNGHNSVRSRDQQAKGVGGKDDGTKNILLLRCPECSSPFLPPEPIYQCEVMGKRGFGVELVFQYSRSWQSQY